MKMGRTCFSALSCHYPELVKARNAFGTQLQALARFAGHNWTITDQRKFWLWGFFESWEGWGYRVAPSMPPHSSLYNLESWRQTGEEASGVSAAIRAVSQEVIARLNEVKEPLVLKPKMMQQLERLDPTLAKLQQWMDEHIDRAKLREAELSKPGASPGKPLADNGQLLAPMPCVNRTGSASSGVFTSTANGLTHKHRPAKRQDTHYAQAFQKAPQDGMLHGLTTSTISKLEAAYHSITRPFRILWSNFRQEPLPTRLGHPTTVWTLIILISLASAASTVLAVCKAGPNTALPEIDSNFYSTLSQNLLSAAGLYCIIMPILLNVNPNVQHPALFHGFLVASAVGTLVYMVHTRTSMVMAYAAALLQLLATLQLIVAQGTKVRRLQVNVEDLEGENARLRAMRD